MNERKNQKPLKALLIEDDLLCQIAEKTLLEMHGFEIDTAGTAEEGLNLLSEKETDENLKPYDVIFVDIKLPDFDGDHIAEVIQKTTPDHITIPILAITAHLTEEKKHIWQGKGISMIIEKPLTENKIQQIMELIFTESRRLALLR